MKYVVIGEKVTRVVLLDAGKGYNSSHPPILKTRGCDGVGGKLDQCQQVAFHLNMGTNCAKPGCCQNQISGTYSVMNGRVQSVTITNGGSGFNHRFPPSLHPQSCNGSVESGGLGCKQCRKGRYMPSGNCPDGSTCGCSGKSAYCREAAGQYSSVTGALV